MLARRALDISYHGILCWRGSHQLHQEARSRRRTATYSPGCRSTLQYYQHPRTGGLDEILVRGFLRQLGKWHVHPTQSKLTLGLARALKFLRRRNLVHRNIKSQVLLPDARIDPSSLVLSLCRIFFSTRLQRRSWLEGHPLEVAILKVTDFGFARSFPNAMMAETLCGSP